MPDEVKTPEQIAQEEAAKKAVEKTNEVDESIAQVLEEIPKILDENAKLKADNENYKTGMMSYKNKLKKLKDEGYDVELEEEKLNSDDIVARVVEQIKPLIQPVQPQQNDLAKKVSELTLALKNKSQIATPAAAGGGSIETNEPPKKEFFSEQQLEELKKRGLNPDKVKENILKYKEKTTVE